MNNLNNQKPWKVSNIENTKPNVPKTYSELTGYIANSMNAGHNKTIAWKRIMAGEKHLAYRLKANFQMLTPLTPAYQKLKMTIRTYFVPDSRVWTNAEKFIAQKGGSAEIKISEMPNTGGKELFNIENATEDKFALISDTELWRDSFISSYISRFKNGTISTIPNDSSGVTLPKQNILALRGSVAIYNDYERNKEYDAEIQEYKDDTVSDAEWNSYFSSRNDKINYEYYSRRAKREKSYYTDYRTELQGFEEELPQDLSANTALINWATWESKMAEARSQAENAQLNDWDILAKIRGSKKLTEGKVQMLSEKTFNLNYSAITQNTYNTNENIQEDFRVMGKQGAYSYTEIDLPLYEGIEFVEEGTIHIIACISADTVFEYSIDRTMLNVKALEQYRPDLEGEKQDVLYELETNTMSLPTSEYDKIIGFKRKYNEYFKLPNIIAGDMTNIPYFAAITDENSILNQHLFDENKQIITNSTYQFFETDRYYHIAKNKHYKKTPWKDYSDLMVNKNQAIMNDIASTTNNYNKTGLKILGQNQCFFVGVCKAIADLPINDEIKNNYTKWGEH